MSTNNNMDYGKAASLVKRAREADMGDMSHADFLLREAQVQATLAVASAIEALADRVR